MTSPREQAIEAAKVIEMVEQLDKLEERYELIFDELAPLPGNRSAEARALAGGGFIMITGYRP